MGKISKVFKNTLNRNEDMEKYSMIKYFSLAFRCRELKTKRKSGAIIIGNTKNDITQLNTWKKDLISNYVDATKNMDQQDGDVLNLNN